jgi:AcrR family transcriptional regulator
MARTQEARRIETRAQLLTAAADLFARKGYHATSAEAVADHADRTTGALYDHFGGKQGLLVALLEQWIGQTIVELGPRVEGEADLDARLGEMWRGLIRHDDESGGAWLLLEFELWLHAAREPELGVVGAARLEAMRDSLAGALARWSTELGFALPTTAPELAAQLIGFLLGLAFQYRLEPAIATEHVVVDGLHRLLGLPAAPRDEATPPTEGTAS